MPMAVSRVVAKVIGHRETVRKRSNLVGCFCVLGDDSSNTLSCSDGGVSDGSDPLLDGRMNR